LHAQCHHLVHFDIPWSLIRIEQRNGRIDRYGQKNPPQITTLLLEPSDDRFSGDVRVFTRLVQKEHEAHRAFDDVGVLMGKYSAEAEEKAIRDALLRRQDIDEVVPEQPDFSDDPVAAMFAAATVSDTPWQQAAEAPVQDGQAVVTRPRAVVAKRLGVYDNDLSYLEDALAEAFEEPQHEIGWKTDSKYHISALNPPTDLQRRLRDLPQEYLRERKVRDELRLATSKRAGQESLDIARASEDTN